jgi:hypothetical protein
LRDCQAGTALPRHCKEDFFFFEGRTDRCHFWSCWLQFREAYQWGKLAIDLCEKHYAHSRFADRGEVWEIFYCTHIITACVFCAYANADDNMIQLWLQRISTG